MTMQCLRDLESSDAPAIYSAVDSSRRALARWMSWYHESYRLEHAEEWLHQALIDRDAGMSHHFALCDLDGQLVGILGFEDIGKPQDQAMIGYWLATPSTGRGLGTAAIREATRWAQAHLQLNTIWAVVAEPNAASRRVLELNEFHRVRDAEPSHYGDRQMIYERQVRALTSSN